MSVLEGLEDSFDNDRAEEMLNLSLGRMTKTSELIRKSMYDFDLDTPEGIEKLMALLPIMDPEILKDIMGELWPGYPTDIDARRHRLEIKGYLKDYLESYDEEDDAEQLQGVELGGPEAGAQDPAQGPDAQGDPAAPGAAPPDAGPPPPAQLGAPEQAAPVETAGS